MTNHFLQTGETFRLLADAIDPWQRLGADTANTINFRSSERTLYTGAPNVACGHSIATGAPFTAEQLQAQHQLKKLSNSKHKQLPVSRTQYSCAPFSQNAMPHSASMSQNWISALQASHDLHPTNENLSSHQAPTANSSFNMTCPSTSLPNCPDETITGVVRSYAGTSQWTPEHFNTVVPPLDYTTPLTPESGPSTGMCGEGISELELEELFQTYSVSAASDYEVASESSSPALMSPSWFQMPTGPNQPEEWSFTNRDQTSGDFHDHLCQMLPGEDEVGQTIHPSYCEERNHPQLPGLLAAELAAQGEDITSSERMYSFPSTASLILPCSGNENMQLLQRPTSDLKEIPVIVCTGPDGNPCNIHASPSSPGKKHLLCRPEGLIHSTPLRTNDHCNEIVHHLATSEGRKHEVDYTTPAKISNQSVSPWCSREPYDSWKLSLSAEGSPHSHSFLEQNLALSPVFSPEAGHQLTSSSSAAEYESNGESSTSTSPPSPSSSSQDLSEENQPFSRVPTESPSAKWTNNPSMLKTPPPKKTPKVNLSALHQKNTAGEIPNSLQLFEFLLHLLEMQKAHTCIKWENASEGHFYIADSGSLAKKWGAYRRKPAMNYDKMSRAMRFYFRRGIFDRIARHRLHFKFSESIMKQVKRQRRFNESCVSDSSEAESEVESEAGSMYELSDEYN